MKTVWKGIKESLEIFVQQVARWPAENREDVIVAFPRSATPRAPLGVGFLPLLPLGLRGLGTRAIKIPRERLATEVSPERPGRCRGGRKLLTGTRLLPPREGEPAKPRSLPHTEKKIDPSCL